MLRCPEPEWVCKIKFIIFFFILFHVFRLFSDKIDPNEEKLLLSMSTSLRADFLKFYFTNNVIHNSLQLK